MEILCCPVCKGDLQLTVAKRDAATNEIESGTLRCAHCDFDYPIEDSIPNLLPPEMHEKKQAKGP